MIELETPAEERCLFWSSLQREAGLLLRIRLGLLRSRVLA